MRILCFIDYDLKIDKFDVVYATDEDDFYDKILNKKYDVLIISFEFFSQFVNIKDYIKSSIIFTTAYCDTYIYKKALEVGDFCYLMHEYDKLLLRLQYLQKKLLKSKSTVYKKDNILYNFNTNELYIDSKPVKLSSAENELLKTLIKNKNTYLSKEDILMECDSIESEASIKVLISHLRKLGINIENQKNLGYKLKE
ncbi:response regulator [Nautilia profundicola AmH]|uniref:Response regulator n=1 Tax=Nautilia profundicola (strain ATCC BAA-1463 / DSM 18972 / AmH) TaxID=598659 RepID=B9L910_NAUPA|nr:winged helix-turn-helix domain-containing protein [Nautilia profundicola]ACM93729.1 response regulator [Nautilia profundicola AmH]